jgi:hypothetical protein
MWRNLGNAFQLHFTCKAFCSNLKEKLKQLGKHMYLKSQLQAVWCRASIHTTAGLLNTNMPLGISNTSLYSLLRYKSVNSQAWCLHLAYTRLCRSSVRLAWSEILCTAQSAVSEILAIECWYNQECPLCKLNPQELVSFTKVPSTISPT